MTKFTKAKAKEFTKKALGLSPTNIQQDTENSYYISSGAMRYSFWILRGRIYMSICVDGMIVASYYFHPQTYEADYEFTSERNDHERDQERLENTLDTFDYLERKNVSIPTEIRESVRRRISHC